MIKPLYDADLKITQSLYQTVPHNGFFDSIFAFLSFQGSTLGIWVILLIALIVFEERKKKRFLIDFLASVGSTFLLVNLVFKNLFERARPFFLIPQSVSACPTSFSFPSGHAAVAYAAATVLSHYDKKRQYVYYSIATLVSFSRIYLGCHFFLDVVAGAAVGYLISRLFLRFNFWKQ